MPKVSIIIPVYNTEQYLSHCLDCILNQSFSDFELLLVDDGSTDESGKICDAYAEKDNRIRVFHKENGGVSSARNLGIDNANGDWMCFVDSDDELIPNGLQVMVDGISDEISMVMGGYHVYDNEGSLIYSIKVNNSCLINPERAAKEMLAPSDYRYQGYIWGKLLRRSEAIQHKIRFSEEVFFNEDRLFLTRFICAMEKRVYYNTKSVYVYYERSRSAMMSLKKGFNPKFATDLKAQIGIKECINSRFDNEELLELANFSVYNSYRRIAGMMKEFNYVDVKLKMQLLSQLVNAIGIRLFIRCEFSRNKRRVLNKIKKR
jgi:glycosyltransferase involved in cell wall biosynthesis